MGSFRLYRKQVLVDLVSLSISKGYVFQMEMMFRAKKMGFSIEEYLLSLSTDSMVNQNLVDKKLWNIFLVFFGYLLQFLKLLLLVFLLAVLVFQNWDVFPNVDQLIFVHK
ncbi:Dolichol-phosphate mannosyltransferase subunit 1, partial [Meloidogyne graminicola]